MTENTYEFFHEYMKSHMARNNPEEHATTTSVDGTLVPVAEEGKLHGQKEPRFTLLRNWSLYDAMYFSPFVSSRLSVWKAPGKARLLELFAKLGVSLDQCKQKWSFVSPASQKRVLEQIESYCETFTLGDLHYKAFQVNSSAASLIERQQAAEQAVCTLGERCLRK